MALPYLAARFLFSTTLEQASLHLLIPDGYYRPKPVLFLLLGYYPLSVLVAGLPPKPVSLSGLHRIPPSTRFAVQVCIIVAATFFLLKQSFTSEEQFTAAVRYLAHKEQWGKILELTGKRPSNDRLVNFTVNRALYHTGRLPYDLFRQHNFWGQHALFLGDHAGGSVLMDNSELYFELGHVRAARQWAYEAQTIFEYSPRVLKMLTLTNIIEGDYPAATMMLSILDKSIMHQKWVRKYMNGIHDTTLFQNDSLIRVKRRQMPTDIAFMSTKEVEKDLLALLKKNPDNRMAFEYLMAWLQLSDRIDRLDLADELRYLKRLGYREMPQTYQEALMVYIARKGYADYDFGGYAINPVNVNGYKDYMTILRDHRENPQEAVKVLYDSYAYSYWYYLQFIYPLSNKRQAEKKAAGK